MSLIVNEGSSREYEPIAEGTYVAVCHQLIDLGLQFNKTYNNSTRKVLIGWEIPELTYEANGETYDSTITKRYTASLNEKSILRRDLIAWRGRDFSQEELSAFNLKNIVGVPCMIQIIHQERNGKKYANIASIMRLPKNMPEPVRLRENVIYDIDENDPEDVDKLPEWLQDIIKASESYQERVAEKSIEPAKFQELADDEGGVLPF